MRAMNWLKWLLTFVIGGFVFAVAMAVEPASPGDTVDLPRPPDVSFELEARHYEERVYYVGASGPILGVRSPELVVHKDDVVSLTLINGLEAASDISIPALGVDSGLLVGRGARSTMIFPAKHVGSFVYCSSFPKLRSEGLIGRFVVKPRPEAPLPLAGTTEPLSD